jgi:large subunit ribosomal protein L1
MKIEEAIKHLREQPSRKFKQTFDLIVTLKNFDLKKPENKFSKEITMPNETGKEIQVGIISDKIPGAITKSDIENMSNNKSEIKKLAKKYDFFLCEPPLMVLVGKVMGRYLGPKGKMPKLLPPNTEPKNMVEALKRSTRIKTTGSASIQTYVGKENLSDDAIKKNVEKVLEELKKTLPKGDSQIKNVMLKMTMSKPVKIE